MQLFVNEVISKSSKLISWLSFLSCIIFSFNCSAFDQFFKLEKFQSWNVILEQNQYTKQNTCHAILKPYRTNKFQGEILNPIFIISYKKPYGYTISFSSLSDFSVKNGVVIKIQESENVLKTTSYQGNAITYSPVQDVNIMNALIYGPITFKIYTTSSAGDFNEHYFYSKGLIEALSYMDKACQIYYRFKNLDLNDHKKST